MSSLARLGCGRRRLKVVAGDRFSSWARESEHPRGFRALVPPSFFENEMKTDAQFCFDELMDTADKLRGIMVDGNEDQVEALSAFQNCMLSAFITKFSEDSGLDQSQTLTLYHATKEFVLQMAMMMEGM